MATSNEALRVFRKLHLYFGLFISPALIFFAVTGALQTFSLHETTAGSDYKPPRWAVVLGQIHKKQTSVVPVKRTPAAAAKPAIPSAGSAGPGNPAAAATRPAEGPAAQKPRSHVPLKIFFLVVSIGLLTSTLTGIYMAYRYERGKLLVTTLLLAGALIPLLLLPF